MLFRQESSRNCELSSEDLMMKNSKAHKKLFSLLILRLTSVIISIFYLFIFLPLKHGPSILNLYISKLLSVLTSRYFHNVIVKLPFMKCQIIHNVMIIKGMKQCIISMHDIAHGFMGLRLCYEECISIFFLVHSGVTL